MFVSRSNASNTCQYHTVIVYVAAGATSGDALVAACMFKSPVLAASDLVAPFANIVTAIPFFTYLLMSVTPSLIHSALSSAHV